MIDFDRWWQHTTNAPDQESDDPVGKALALLSPTAGTPSLADPSSSPAPAGNNPAGSRDTRVALSGPTDFQTMSQPQPQDQPPPEGAPGVNDMVDPSTGQPIGTPLDDNAEPLYPINRPGLQRLPDSQPQPIPNTQRPDWTSGEGALLRAPITRDNRVALSGPSDFAVYGQPTEQPYDPDQGPRESGYRLPGQSSYNDPTAGGTQTTPIPQPVQSSYNDPTAGGTITQPLPQPTYADPTITDSTYTGPPAGVQYDPNDPTTYVNPDEPGTLRPTDLPPALQGARPWNPPVAPPQGPIRVAPHVLDQIVPRSVQTAARPVQPQPPELNPESGLPQTAPYTPPSQQEQQIAATHIPQPGPPRITPRTPNAHGEVADQPSDQQILQQQGPTAQAIDTLDRTLRSPEVQQAAATLAQLPTGPGNPITPIASLVRDYGRGSAQPAVTPSLEDASAFMGGRQNTPSGLLDWHDRMTVGAADALARGLGDDPSRVVVGVKVGGMPLQMTVSDLLQNVTDPAFGAGFSVGDMVLDAVGEKALHLAAPYLKGAARGVANALLDRAPAIGRGLAAVDTAIQTGGHRALDAIEAGAGRVGRAFGGEPAPAGAPGTLGVFGPQTPEVRIPRAGYAADISPGAENMVRNASERNAPQEVVRRADVARKAEQVLGLSPETVQAWQDQALTEGRHAPEARAVRGEALRQAEYIDAENADRAIERLRAAQDKARQAKASGLELSEADNLEIADALLEAAQTARAFETSAAASTAEGRASARALGQRRSVILAREAYATAARARQVGQDAAFAAQEAQRAAQTGQLTPQGQQRLQTLRDKLLDAERHGLVGDGAGGRLDALEQRTAESTAAARVGPSGPHAGVPLGTRIAYDVGNAALGGVVGATGGAALPADSPEQRRQNALRGAAVGAVGFPVAGRLMRGRGRGAMAVFGPAPTPEMPNRALAIGADPAKRYEMRYRVVDLGELVPSNLPNGAPNPAFPRALQPRARERVASQLQIDQIARGLEPDALLTDVGRLDAGPMIVGPDRVVESGNGRTLALQRAAEQYPERYQAYVDSLRRNLGDYGLSERDLQGIQNPVLVRERVTPVNRAAFAQEANNAGLLRMSSFEQAAQDAGNLTDDTVSALTVGENDTIASALRKTENRDLVRRWVGTLPENERAGVLDANGQLSAQGYERLTNALLVRTYGEGAGERLARAFIESADPTVRNVQTALMASLPDMARAESLVRSGQRDAGLSLADDVATAAEMLARLKRDGMSVGDYLSQSAMFERELTPLQESILQYLDQNQRRPSAIRDALKEYASRVENTADPNQVDMFGGQVAAPTREDLWRGATAESGVRVPEPTPLEARAATVGASADGAGLASAAPEPVAPRAPAPERPAAVRPEPVTPQQPATPSRTPAHEIVPSTGGPEGRLRREGAFEPDPFQPRTGDVAPATGGPEGSLAQEGAPRQPTPFQPRSGDVAPSTGGPEARRNPLTGEMEPGRPAPGPASAPVTGGPEGRLAPGDARESRQIDQARIRGIAAQIDEVLANPNAPGVAERLQQLHADLQEISRAGFQRSSQIRQRLQRNGLLRAGLAGKTTDVTPLVNALSRVDPDKPEEMQAVLQILKKPRLIDRILEYQYVNMLSSPITQGVNILANTAQIAGRLLLQNPLEFVFSGGRSTGVGAAFQGAARGFKEGLGEAGQIMRTGTSTNAIDTAIETGQYGRINTESLPAWMHVISTRPLAAMDALLGHVAYASAAEQYAQRTADRLLANGSAAVKGMDRVQARQHVLSNIWDYPDVIEKAGNIQDYTLLKGRGNSPVERGLRMLASSHVPEDAGFGEQFKAFMANQIMPFVGVPINYAKQGAERTVGVPVNAFRAARAYARGDVEQGAELAAKATIGASALMTAGVLAYGDNLTGDGPSDPGQRKVWEQTHRPNSFRVPGTSAWVSWEGTPFAIPFGMVAGMKEGASEALERSQKKGQTDLVDVVGSAALKTGQGASQAFLSQSFVRGLADQYKLLTGQDVSLSQQASAAAGTISRFVPASGMVNFLARVTDSMQRDTGRPQAASEMPQAVGARLATRIPGAREQLNPALDIYGQPTPNEQYGVAGALPYYRGAGPRAGDPITQALEAAGVGINQAPDHVTINREPSDIKIPTDMLEQRRFYELRGQAYRSLLEQNDAGRGDLSKAVLDKIEARANQIANEQLKKEIGGDELQRRFDRGRQAVGAR